MYNLNEVTLLGHTVSNKTPVPDMRNFLPSCGHLGTTTIHYSKLSLKVCNGCSWLSAELHLELAKTQVSGDTWEGCFLN